MSPEELDRRYDEIVSRYPQGITPAQFRQITLASADEDGRVHPHPVSDYFAYYGLLIGMYLDGLITRRCRRDEVGPWYITKKGQEQADADRG